jgi:hypothetical protein
VYTRNTKKTKASTHAYAEQYAITTYTARVSISNAHAFALDNIVVRDAIPVSEEDQGARVILNRPTVLVEANDGEDKEVDSVEGSKGKVRWTKRESDTGKGGLKQGMFEWACKLDAGEKITFEAEWIVKAPTDLQWIESSF